MTRSTMNWKRWLQLVLGMGLSVFFIWWALRGVDFPALGRALETAHYIYLLPTLALMVVVQLLRVYRFKYLASPLVDMKFPALFRIDNIGMMAVSLLPVRLGEFVRPYLMKKEYGFGLSSGLGPVAAERVVDGLVVTIAFFIVTHSGWDVDPALKKAGVGALLLFVGAAVALGIVLIGHEKGADLLRRMVSVVSPKLGGKMTSIVTGFAIGLRGLAKPKTAFLYIFMTVAVWGLSGVANWILLAAFDIQQPLMTGMILIALMVIAVMVPSGPGFIGPFQFAIVTGLTALGADKTSSFAYSILIHFATLATGIGFGMYSLLSAHLSMTNLVAASQAGE